MAQETNSSDKCNTPHLLDGYTDLPAGKLANVATYLEMLKPVELQPEQSRDDVSLVKLTNAEPAWYRSLFRRIGENYLWFSRLALSDEQLQAILWHPSYEVYAVRYMDSDEGLLELDLREAGECEIAFFGLTDRLVGKGVGRWLMNRAIETAWKHPIRRFWLHTCTQDHPSALGFYIRSGFKPFKRQLEISDDPRTIGLLPPEAAPHIPLL